MLTSLRSRALSSLSSSSASSSSSSSIFQSWKLGFPRNISLPAENYEHLNLQEIEKILTDVQAGDVKVIPVNNQCDWTDFMVIATGTSTWHVRNIAQALIYKAKQKQQWADRKALPSVQGQEGGKWVVIDAGSGKGFCENTSQEQLQEETCEKECLMLDLLCPSGLNPCKHNWTGT